MKFLKFIFAAIIASGIVLLGYFFVWNFMASKRQLHIKQMLDNVSAFTFSYDDFRVSGYPKNININVENLNLKSKEAYEKIKVVVGDVAFRIYPFVIEQQAKINLPKSQFIYIEDLHGNNHQYKIESEFINLVFLNNEINLELQNAKIYSVTNDKLLANAGKIYYESFLDNQSKFKLILKDLEFASGYKVESALVDLELSSLQQLDLLGMIVSHLRLEGTQLNNYMNDIVTYLAKFKSQIKLNNLKFITKDSWFEIITNLELDSRNRFAGDFNLVSDKLETAEQVLKFLTSNQTVDTSTMPVISRMIGKEKNNVVRLDGKLEKGSLYIFKNRLARVKPFKL
ncbi:MAG: hypothetical protein GY793_09665 [Proteobacteria bacterium]|nr:hypothetical protein [Pseudomonadota bacterium]